MDYTIVNLEQDIAEIICQSGSNNAFLELNEELRVPFINLITSQIKPFMLGRYNMTYDEAGKVLKKFLNGALTEKSFIDKVVVLVKSNYKESVQ